LVREVVVPVRKPADKTDADSAFFRLLSAADLLDFPGVANQHANASEPTLINPRTTQDDHPRWLTAVFKRGKTESMVLGYAKDVTVDAFALLVKAQTFPPRPKQLTAGIEHWWKCVDPDYKASDAAPGRWFEESRDLATDFAHAFPAEAAGGWLPRLAAVGIAGDGDNTGARSVAFIEALRLEAR
jgi:hypothetical protein